MKSCLGIFNIWGKYSDEQSHPLIYHMIDTACVAEVLIGLMEQEITPFQLALVALHDIGKATPGFQAKVPEMKKMLEEHGFSFTTDTISEGDHSKLSQWYLSILLEAFCKMDEEIASEWSRIVSSHHGKVLNLFVDTPVDDGQIWNRAREIILERIFELYSVTVFPKDPPTAWDALFLMGLCSVADWIASNENYFPYRSNFSGTLEEYKSESLKMAKNAVDTIGFHRAFTNQKTFDELFPFAPNSLQEAAIEHVSFHEDEPMLMIVEAPMGEGKTEAALGAFAQKASLKPQKGLFFALPTQATSNMMFSRLEDFASRFATQGAQLHLLHADAMLNEAYRQLKIRSVYGENGAAISASEWFVSKKRALLADFGVGTVDQAELAALKVKHFFVRLFALAGKTVIIDEVHAYDAYMSGVLEVLLGWLRQMGSSVILLSATLPETKRRMLLEAFMSEHGSIKLASYPVIHSISSKGVKSESIDGLRSFIGTIMPIPSDDWMEAVSRLCEKKLEHGGCAACIVNTVSDAQRLYVRLKERFPEEELEIFHARFSKKDRLVIEKRIVERFGKNGKRPERAIVVATQVIEQSLDVDFDLMVTQPAPIDLLLQRMGRLHRHERMRPEGLEDRTLYVLVPVNLEDKKEIFGKSRFVYYPDILYKSVALLRKEGRWQEKEVCFPKGLSPLVEAVYGDVLSEESIQKWEEEREGEEYAHYFLSRSATIPQVEESADVLDGIDNVFEDDTDAYNAKTRLGEENVMVVMVENSDDIHINEFYDIKRLYESSLKVSNGWLCKHFKSVDTPESWKNLPLLRYAKPFQMGETIEENGYVAYYDKKLGFVIKKEGEEL